ncbi:MAG: hypothetical protein AUG49_15835 [Catenulispora sp. 13_1_20CM_3_70_7]|nr:MAG: hypothetical protein AUG49_15835 [Catenulispora sp. 13_1_20CM_3_70_7]
MSRLRFPPHLDVAAWEKVLGGPSAAFAPDGAIEERLAQDGLHLDFMRVEWVDFSVLARALLLLDAASQLEIPVTVTMPALDLTPRELAAVDRASASVTDDMASLERQMRYRARLGADR